MLLLRLLLYMMASGEFLCEAVDVRCCIVRAESVRRQNDDLDNRCSLAQKIPYHMWQRTAHVRVSPSKQYRTER